ncbi:TetR/AcrR family transcriptional regulator [Pseudoduganella ginsengisoli]|uniref:TetR family transcriptional regulator n=1 Tax=Pseudoduganella ginsengisoli TaxID=1462440 RepID=A0A6L6Q0R3_9BURK|nr:TetR/AcrR family transcriptional regulator [Pseudoduganella ginsengisoli]MTW02622.1 TetR family transcriptional regulator [Pseudoduganella ginsengisoli]
MTDIPRPRKAPQQARSRNTVDVILEATARVFAQHGYAGTNTNLIAEKAGISVGSLYQYFPHKDALIAALHQRHAEQVQQAIETVLAQPVEPTLAGHIGAMVRALLAAHLLEPALHKMLEQQFPYFDAPQSENETDLSIFKRVRTLLDDWRADIVPRDLDLATWVILRIMQSMVHAAVIDAPPFATSDIEVAIIDAVMGYLSYRPASTH